MRAVLISPIVISVSSTLVDDITY